MLRSDYVLGQIYSSKNLAKKVSEDYERQDKVDVLGPDADTAVLGSITLKLESIGELHQKVLEEIHELQDDLFGGIGFDDDEWMPFKVPDRFMDYVNSDQPGYCFGDEEQNGLAKYRHHGLKILLRHPWFKDRYGCMVSGGIFIPNAVACHDFLRRASHITSKFATDLYISPGGFPRGTELTSHTFRNLPQGNPRNIRILGGALCLVAGYNKTTGLVSFLFLPRATRPSLTFSLDREIEEDMSLSPQEPPPCSPHPTLRHPTH